MCVAHAQVLNLHGHAIRSMEPRLLSELRCLRVLVLSFNEIAKIEGVEGLPQLEVRARARARAHACM